MAGLTAFGEGRFGARHSHLAVTCAESHVKGGQGHALLAHFSRPASHALQEGAPPSLWYAWLILGAASYGLAQAGLTISEP